MHKQGARDVTTSDLGILQISRVTFLIEAYSSAWLEALGTMKIKARDYARLCW